VQHRRVPWHQPPSRTCEQVKNTGSIPTATDLSEIGYEDFRARALDADLTQHEKIGFPDAYREGFEEAIYADIKAKLPALSDKGRKILDIGPGCAGLPRLLIQDCRQRGHELVLLDSPEMLAQLPDGPGLTKVPGFYPECHQALEPWLGGFDAIVCYSVLQYLFVEANWARVIDLSLDLLAPGGAMLLGDVPNVSKRKRFFASPAGIRFHREFMKTNEAPGVDFNAVEHGKIDDAALLGLIMRVRAQGCDAYWLPQPATLPMANRREDILLIKP
jgi:SAM-dependent methyltransferase